MAFNPRYIACVIICCAMSGCAANDLMLKRQAEVEAKVEHLIQTDKKTLQHLNEQAGQIQILDERLKGESRELKQAQGLVQELRASLDELKVKMALLAKQVATPKIEVVNQEPASKTRDSGPPAEYVKAFGLYSTNNFSAAIEAFELFLRNDPQSEYVSNGLYWVGECYYSLSDLPKALATFQKVVENFPKSAKAPDAMLKRGYTLTALKQNDQAVAAYEALIKSYPSSSAAAKARERLTAN